MRIGVLGGGQLGQMLALAGIPLGNEFRFFDPSPEAPARLHGEHVCAAYDDFDALARFADGLEVCTYEFENVSLAAASFVNDQVVMLPNIGALAEGQNRAFEKVVFENVGIPVPRYALVETLQELQRAADDLSFPGVLKTLRMGYDGKGQVVVRRESEIGEDWKSIGERPAIYEKFVAFDDEVSIIAARSKSGEVAFYPLVENVHKDGILRTSNAPATCAAEMQSKAEGYAVQLLKELDYVGVLAIEFFRIGNELLANEMAPRVHNSGHWTIEGSVCSQFENHIRAITGMELGSTAMTGKATMTNIIGELPDISSLPSNAHLHLYGKSPRPGRKLGHITVIE